MEVSYINGSDDVRSGHHQTTSVWCEEDSVTNLPSLKRSGRSSYWGRLEADPAAKLLTADDLFNGQGTSYPVYLLSHISVVKYC